MSLFKILLSEIGYRKLDFVLSLSAVVMAVTLLVAGPMLIDGHGQATEAQMASLHQRVTESAAAVAASEEAQQEELAALKDRTRVVQRDLGFNLAIVSGDTDRATYQLTGLPQHDMSEAAIKRLAFSRSLTMVTHLVATLRRQATFEGKEVRLVGYQPETPQSHMGKKKPMGYQIEPGTVQIGFLVGDHREEGNEIEVGDEVVVEGKTFRVASILEEKGTDEDVTIAMHLSDAQAISNKPDMINQILALECNCPNGSLAAVRGQIEMALPGVLVLRDDPKARARELQRKAVQERFTRIVKQHERDKSEREQALAFAETRRESIQGLMSTLARTVTPLVVVAAAIWVGLLALANVRSRRTEIGILRALGKGSLSIASLFLGKAVLLGLAGAVVGLAAGFGLACWFGASALEVAAEYIRLSPAVVLPALLGAPLLSALVSYPPTMIALTQDPAIVLRDQ